MFVILEGLLKGLILWLYGLILDGVNAMANALLEVFDMNLSYFEQYAPVTGDIMQVIIATGWAMLIGNLVFQAMRSMTTGLGFEAEDPQILITRTFVFGFLLVASWQICDIGLGITGTVMDMLQIPDTVNINTPDESMLGAFDAAWIWMVIIGIILIWQIVKFFFEIGERYVVLSVLTIMAPLAFGMGGSKNTEDIFKGWARMYGSMCVMMVMNVVFLKLLLSAMSTVPAGAGLIPWLIFVVAIARVGRKVDDLVCRIGLNPARTGDPLGRGIPIMVSMHAAKMIGNKLGGANTPKQKPLDGSSGAAPNAPRPGPVGPSGNSGGHSGSFNGREAGQSSVSSAYSSHSVSTPIGQAVSSMAQGIGNTASAEQPHSVQRQSTQKDNYPKGRPSGGQPMGAQIRQNRAISTNSRRISTRPVNIDVEYEKPQASTMATHPQPGNPDTGNSSKSVSTPSRPPIQRALSGNLPNSPAGLDTTPHLSHSPGMRQKNNTATDSIHKPTSAATTQARSASPPSPPITTRAGEQGTNTPQNAVSPQQQSMQPPFAGTKNPGTGNNRGTQPQESSRPPIGQNSTIRSIPLEAPPKSPEKDSASQPPSPTGRESSGVQVTYPSIAQDLTTSSDKRYTPTPQRPLQTDQRANREIRSVQYSGRKGETRPKGTVPPTQVENSSVGSTTNPGRNSTSRQSPPQIQGRERSVNPPTSPARNNSPQGVPSAGNRSRPQHPPIGHNRQPPGGDAK